MRNRLLTAVIPVLLLAGCSPRVITRIEVQRDTTYITNHTRDSVYVRDSVFMKEYVKGDTVYQIKYRDRWRERIKEVHDTSYISKTDSVQVVVPVEVEKRLPLSKRIKLWAFFPLVLATLIGWRKEIISIVKKLI